MRNKRIAWTFDQSAVDDRQFVHAMANIAGDEAVSLVKDLRVQFTAVVAQDECLREWRARPEVAEVMIRLRGDQLWKYANEAERYAVTKSFVYPSQRKVSAYAKRSKRGGLSVMAVAYAFTWLYASGHIDSIPVGSLIPY